MLAQRRRFLSAAIAFGAAAAWPRRAKSASGRPRAVVIGGGWGGLAAARYLREFAPEFEVTLLERNAAFWSCPLSNKWLVGQIDGALLSHDYARAANAWKYRFVQAEVTAINREKRLVASTAGNFGYDWLVISAGIRHDYAAWFGEDRESARLAQAAYPAAYTPGKEFATLRDKLIRFKGGTLLMTVPPAPFRCPPAPYERAALLAGWFEQRGLPGRIVLLDPNPPFKEFQRIFRARFPERIAYEPQTTIRGIDLQRREVQTDSGATGFDDAILMPPQQAADLAWQAGLIGSTESGAPSGWAATDPLTLAAKADPRIYLVGDMIDRVSPLFGHYPKSGQMAARQGRIAAAHIAAQARGKEAPPDLPDSVCHIATQYDPPEAIRIATTYRRRGDGVTMQQLHTVRDPQPRGEDVAWAQGLFAEILATPEPKP